VRTKLLTPILILLLFTTGFRECSREEKASFKRQAVSKVDTLANSIKAAQGVNEDLYEFKKISKETTVRNTEVLLKANKLGKQLGEKVRAIDPNSTTLPPDISSIVDEIEKALKTLDVGPNELVKVVGDSLKIILEIRSLIK
jgi:hypothetical protein